MNTPSQESLQSPLALFNIDNSETKQHRNPHSQVHISWSMQIDLSMRLSASDVCRCCRLHYEELLHQFLVVVDTWEILLSHTKNDYKERRWPIK